jgi:isopenicillin N synthase-like dioxygenase
MRRALAQQIRKACRTIGFFYGTSVFLFSRSGSNFISIAVKNHGISQNCLDEVLKVIQEYYSLSADEKMKVRLSGSLRLIDANVL